MKKFRKNFQGKNKNGKTYNKKLESKTDIEFDFCNPIMESYYKDQLSEYFVDQQDDWNKFWGILRERLPVTFRISSNIANSEIVARQFRKGKQYVEELYNEQKEQQQQNNQELTEEQKQEQEQIEKLLSEMDITPVQWYENVFELKCDRQQLQKKIKKFHQKIETGNQYGLLTRQELVSMLPPLLLDPNPTDVILDMCAAPGSKTVQLLEIMQEKGRKNNIPFTGCLVSNELSTQRSTILSHQINRSASHASLVINHQAQFFPALYKQENENSEFNQLKFDKVLADVPCTGDGAIRKIPQKWQDWKSVNAMKLHCIQLSILTRALQVTKVGGLVLYSTCSIDPIEDEAVVCEAMRKCEPDSLELVDCHELLPQFQGRKGLYDWKVLLSKINKDEAELSNEELYKKSYEEMFDHIKQYSDLTEEQLTNSKQDYRWVKESMFPESEEKMKQFQIEKTMRVLPHDQNSGGFYVALFRKKKETVFRFEVNQHLVSKRDQKREKQRQYMEEMEKQRQERINNGETVEELQEKFFVKKKPKQIYNIQDELNISDKIIEEYEEDIKFIKTIDPNTGPETLLRNQRIRELKAWEKEQQKYQKQIQQFNEQLKEQQIKEQQGEGDQEKSELKKPQLDARPKIFELYKTIEDSQFKEIQDLYQLEGIEKDQFITPEKSKQGKIRYVSKAVRDFLKHTPNQKNTNLIVAGSRVFSKKPGAFRICQDGVKLLFPYITKRKLKTSMKNLLSLIKKEDIPFENIQDEEFRKQIMEFGPGGLVLYTDPCEQYPDREIIALHLFKHSLQTLLGKENKEGFSIVYDL